jgi:hypothetical protein
MYIYYFYSSKDLGYLKSYFLFQPIQSKCFKAGIEAHCLVHMCSSCADAMFHLYDLHNAERRAAHRVIDATQRFRRQPVAHWIEDGVILELFL